MSVCNTTIITIGNALHSSSKLQKDCCAWFKHRTNLLQRHQRRASCHIGSSGARVYPPPSVGFDEALFHFCCLRVHRCAAGRGFRTELDLCWWWRTWESGRARGHTHDRRKFSFRRRNDRRSVTGYVNFSQFAACELLVKRGKGGRGVEAP